jgi:hypothetical protein
MMDRFAPVLDRVSRGLALPEPERSRVMEEMTSDLEGLYEAYRERGMSEAEAVRRAEQALAASAEALAELSRIHAPLHRRLAEHYAEPGRHRAERWLLVLLAGGTVAWVAVTQATRAPGGASIFFWAVLAVAAAVCALVPLAGYAGMSARGDTRSIARRARDAILALGLLAVLLAALGAALDLYQAASSLRAAAEWSVGAFVPWLGRIADLLATGLAVGLGAGLAWFFLESRALRVVQSRGAMFRGSTPWEDA